MRVYRYRYARDHSEEHKALEEGLLRLDRRERGYVVTMWPMAAVGDSLAVASVVATGGGLIPMRSVMFRRGGGVRPSGGCVMECPRGDVVGGYFEVGWVNEVGGAGQVAAMRYRFGYIGDGGSSVVTSEVVRLYRIPSAGLVYGRDRVELSRDDLVGGRLLTVYVTRLNNDVRDTYAGAPNANKRNVHIVEVRFKIRGEDGEDV